MDVYARWTTPEGLPFDPWLRVHARAGARIVKVCPESMIIPGTVAEWEEWTEMRFPASGTVRRSRRARARRDRRRGRSGRLRRAERLDAPHARLRDAPCGPGVRPGRGHAPPRARFADAPRPPDLTALTCESRHAFESDASRNVAYRSRGAPKAPLGEVGGRLGGTEAVIVIRNALVGRSPTPAWRALRAGRARRPAT